MNDTDYHRTHVDIWLLFTVVLLVGLGITMVYSSSAVLAQERFGDSYFFLKRTVMFAAFGGVLTMIIVRVP